MSTTEAIYTTLVFMASITLELGLIFFIGWLIVKFFKRRTKDSASAARSKPDPNDPGSLSVLDYSGRKRQPIALTIAVIAGVSGTIGSVLYWIGDFSRNPMIGLIGFALAAGGTIGAGIIFGTSDRDYYL